MMDNRQNILEIDNLQTFFFTRQGTAKAVNGVGFRLRKGEILGVVGESGCGKSMTAFSVLRLVPYPGRIVRGSILFNGQDLLDLHPSKMRRIRGDRISMIFQEPMISLNPAFTVGRQLIEALRVHRKISTAEAGARAVAMLRQVDIASPEQRMRDYPHQLSGGMRQRVMIAEALLLRPQVLLADEPTTALDVTIQAQVLDVMYRLTQEMHTAILLITHNLGLVAESAARVVVMYAGKVVEQGTVEDIFENTAHPYTRGLLKSIPRPGRRLGQKQQLLDEMAGVVPSLYNLPQGCAFQPRCRESLDICGQQNPPWVELASLKQDEEHGVLCWRHH